MGTMMSASAFASPDIENDCEPDHEVPGLWSEVEISKVRDQEMKKAF